MSNAFSDHKDSSITFRLQNYGAMENRLLSANAEIKSLREQHLFERASREGFIKRLEQQLQQKEQENQELKDDYKDLKDSIQRYFQTLIARNYNNIGIWSSERQDYNYQLIEELEKLLKAHNNLSA